MLRTPELVEPARNIIYIYYIYIISSRNTMYNTNYTSHNPFNSSSQPRLTGVCRASLATALANMVLPLPGGPKSRTPRGGLRTPEKSNGFLTGATTISQKRPQAFWWWINVSWDKQGGMAWLSLRTVSDTLFPAVKHGEIDGNRIYSANQCQPVPTNVCEVICVHCSISSCWKHSGFLLGASLWMLQP